MLHFDSDYMETAHPAILHRFSEIIGEQNTGYGFDQYTKRAAEKIAVACGKPDALVKFLVGGTQTNATVIDAFLRKFEGVISVAAGHIATHEAGAIEGNNHKVLPIEGRNGKVTKEVLSAYLKDFYDDENYEHMVLPKMVYISHPTEDGTLYTRDELRSLREICDQYRLYLYLDGARLGYGLTAPGADVTLKDIAEYCDAFYIGGTKVGAMCGEAVVIPDPQVVPHFFTHIKQHGALLAKGWVLGLQFDVLFTDDLYYKLGKHANEMALLLKKGLKEKGYRFYIDSPTNQQFIVVDEEQLKRISRVTTYGFWCKYDENHTVIRLATSWATKPEDVTDLLANI